MQQEIWKWIPGFEDMYQASNLGQIKSFRACPEGKIMTGSKSKDGRIRVNLQGKKYLLHRLILLTFDPEGQSDENCLVLHLDGDCTNNNLENLKWGSYKDNANDEIMFERCKKTREKNKSLRKEAQKVIKGEEWKDIKNYEGHYQVSNLGRIKSIKRNQELIMSNIIGRNSDYQTIKLRLDGIEKQYSIHRLVAEAFCNNPYHYTEINHIDENVSNNCASNLEWVSHSQNVQHSIYRQSYPIIQYDLTYNLIAEYPSIIEAARKTGHARETIKKYAENGKLYDNCYWRFKE